MKRTEIERFVRDTLGCGCPDEVFEQIEYGPPPAALAALGVERRLLVGGRLLAYIVPCGPRLPAIRKLVEAGRSERDREGYNRFRLVLAATDPEQVRAAVEGEFAAAASPDDRVHLHAIEASNVHLG